MSSSMEKLINFKKQLTAILALSLIYIIWACVFIYRSSFIGIDGKRYFVLFDDAMISMRYAWHLSHGYGLGWNVGERVEGITNLLWTLWMSLATWAFSKSDAVLFIQISGIVLVLGVAFLAVAIAGRINRETHSVIDNAWKSVFLFAAVIMYYPLSYWSLFGMETGFLTLLILTAIFVVLKYGARVGVLWPLLGAFALAIWTRPDALIPVLLIISYRFLFFPKNKETLKVIVVESLITTGIVLLRMAFSLYYYGELWPNTYTLKLTGMPALARVSNGIGFIKPYLLTVVPLFGVLALDYKTFLNSENSKQKILLLSIISAAIIYQIWVGGDPWPYWRMMATVMPLLFIVSVDSVFNLTGASQLKSEAQWAINHADMWLKMGRFARRTILFAVILSAYAAANYKFLGEQFYREPAYQTDAMHAYVDYALVTNEVLINNASIALVAAGTMPYYSNFKAIDMLGKSDKHVARMPPDMSGAMSWSGMRSVPGHNKYDLRYSIIGLKPTFLQCFIVGRDDLTDYALEHYARVQYKGIDVWLLANSEDVLWSKIQIYLYRPRAGTPSKVEMARKMGKSV